MLPASLVLVLASLLLAELAASPALAFDPPTYNATVWKAFAAKTLLTPFPELHTDPYEASPPINTTWPAVPVCAVVYPNEPDRSSYKLATFPTRAAAEAAPATFVTHLHPCGLCSTTQDLAVYMAKPDLTDPVRKCGLETAFDKKLALDCLLDIGFSKPCAQIWMYDAINSFKHCLEPCIKAWIEHTPNNVPPNSYNMNPCLACDQEKSGPVFGVVAARIRRDSGLRSSINRPPSSIANITHYYY
ncbi:uncharacterized protein AMSG_06382 [Thecamonas trahens ATCC 50062]|uniref:Uncharacterized protein n=1 Tax=Thecamonas trahens ATCC 50062 TaxID=461836 RepID=A0A0L0DD18_THETB|nr:hypothetical protein AMSG_06382 [Thecamonas trahens ATCC 50062]KNC50229.1 hypothetical protein AMSG_06382 [Thecamonas trahens ATCC 50062]|eukprot:XP_013757060.1 hypothetical protein AMSG_06382 [Thecamonas trahens ATCC 50062]